MKDKLTYSTIYVDMLKTAVLVLVCKEKETLLRDLPKVYKELKVESTEKDIQYIKESLEDDVALPLGCTITLLGTPSKDVIVIFNADSILNVAYETIVHEMYHAMRSLCKSKGIDDEETEAYLLEHLFHTMLNNIDATEERQNKRKPKKNTKKKT